MPGCENAKQLDATHYEAILTVKVQFMTIRAKALGTVLEAEEPRHLVGEMVGEPQAMAGAFRARVTIDLVPVNNGTNVQYIMDITMLGRLASLGEAIVHSTARRISMEFADNISKQFNNPHGP
jgi:carbon monoxide dehydrogenase subunit G